MNSERYILIMLQCENEFRLKNKPKYILLENVKGFEKSEARSYLVSMFRLSDYSYQVGRIYQYHQILALGVICLSVCAFI